MAMTHPEFVICLIFPIAFLLGAPPAIFAYRYQAIHNTHKLSLQSIKQGHPVLWHIVFRGHLGIDAPISRKHSGAVAVGSET
jgi:hypothetical protein